jgi:hypothetical protein
LKLDKNISELLFRYDCVIVPDFGGFIANYKPAKINSKTDMFSPPSKQISFNRNLVVNDGLLANQIARNYGISYNEALETIEKCVSAYQRDLSAGKKVVIEKVGVLYLDANRKILFEPLNTVNYLSDAFGLEKFHYPLAQEEEKVISIKPKKRLIHPGRVAAAVFIPLFIAGTWFAYQAGVGSKYGDFQFSDLSFSTPTNTYVTRTPVEIPAANSKSIDDAFIAFEIKAKARKVKEIPVEIEVKKEWFVIGGCFSEKSNANKFLKRLKHKGYDAMALGNYKSLEAIAYGGFVNEDEARRFLKTVKSKESKSAWLLRR